MTTTMDGESDGHGKIFMGLYCQLLARYLRLDPETLHQTAQQDGIASPPTHAPSSSTRHRLRHCERSEAIHSRHKHGLGHVLTT